VSRFDKLEYPVFSNVPQGGGDEQRDKAYRMGFARCQQWMNSTSANVPGVVVERPTCPFTRPDQSHLADAYEEGWSAALSSQAKGRGF